MACGKFHVQSYGLFWLMSTVYLVHTAFVDEDGPTDAVFSLVIFRPRIAGGNITIPIDSGVRLVKCSRREAFHNTIRLRYGHGKGRKCIVMRAIDSLEREKWLVGLIRAIGAAGEQVPTSTVLPLPSEDASYTSDDTITSSTDDLDDFTPLMIPNADTRSSVNKIRQETTQDPVTIALKFLTAVSSGGRTS